MPEPLMDGEPLTDEEIRAAVQDALDELPAEIAAKLENVAVVLEDRHPSGSLLGLFERSMGLSKITIYRQHHGDAEEVKRTVFHEIGHYFGMDEKHVRGLGL
jgi:predicted Zn-dependent protease with MMP-like domain